MKKNILFTLLVATLLASCGAECNHIDQNKDHLCDLCNFKISDCKDENKDHICDYCGAVISTCIDENDDCFCDLCDKEMPAPEDCIDWPEKDVQDLVKEIAASDVVVPHFNWSDYIEINTDELESEGYFGVWCFLDVEDNKFENVYLKVLQKAGWEVSTKKDSSGFYNAQDPAKEVKISFNFNSELSDVEIYISSARIIKWPEKDIQDLVIVVSGSEAKIPHYDDANHYEIDTSYIVDDGYFGIYCYTKNEDSENKYKQILLDAGWELEEEKDEQGYWSAYDPNLEVWLNFGYFDEYKDLEIYVTICYKTRWPEAYIAESLQKIKPDTETVIPKFQAFRNIATYYPEYGVLAINGYGFENTIVNDYKQILKDLGWDVSYNDNSDEWEGVSPAKDIEIHFYLNDSEDEFNVDVMKHAIVISGWPEDQINAAIIAMDATGTVPAYIGGNQTSFAYSDDMFGYMVVVHLKNDIDEQEEASAYINYLTSLGYVDVGTDLVDRYYALPGTTVGITAYFGSEGTFTIAFLHTDELVK